MNEQKKDKILIFGATGMLGHKLMQVLSKKFSTNGTVRADASAFSHHPVFAGMNIKGNVHADDLNTIHNAIQQSKPDVIVNCIGIVKQLRAAQDPLQSIKINALFPHQLAKICQEKKIRFIHMSTDCVFSGNKGYYTEDDPSDADDLYGKTKYLGEVDYPGCLTIRTSIIGRELDTTHGLIEWFMSQKGKKVSGYKKAVFSGLTTIALSEIISQIISDYPGLRGVNQIASEPISKFDLLNLVKDTYKIPILIEQDETIINDRSLNPKKFNNKTDIMIPSWEKMIDQMYRDSTPYDSLRNWHAHK
jgi:dTDP-4-dehydrorhamnose reductase